jgi:hypothetical protein
MREPRHPLETRTLALAFAAALTLSPAAALGQAEPTEGYDPMRQITAQLMKANLHIVQDVTGSMTSYPESPDDPARGVNGFGYLAWSSGRGSRCSNSLCYDWDYTLTFNGPSRMGIVKNALGSSVPIVTAWAPPTSLPARWSLQGTASTTPSQRTWTYRYTSPNRVAAPGVPFVPFETIAIAGTNPAYTVGNFPIVRAGACTVGTCTFIPPQDLIGRNARRVNWGLTTYSSSATTLVQIDPTDQNRDLARLKDYFLPSGATGLSGVGGLGASGSTNTREGLREAKLAIQRTANRDPKVINRCERPYGVILVTDGLSNSGNPSSGNWISPCGTGYTTCDPAGQTSGIDCPASWTRFAANEANELYMNTSSSGGVPIPVRTWTIGVSSQVGPCELDFVAYMGRTDASSPGGDAGWSGYDAEKNPFIPGAASNPDNYDGPTGQYRWYRDTGIGFDAALAAPGGAHGHNAFFATSAERLAEALVTIVNATATGDYATNAPVSGMAASAANMVYLPSTDFPAWRGHVYAFDTRLPPTDPAYLVWDAGAVLNATPAASRKIFTWDPSNGNALVEVTTARLADLQAIAGTPALTAEAVDFIRGNDGNGTPRSWRLGPLINSAPALVGVPGAWLQGTTVDHRPFQNVQSGRDALIWVGSNDGALHAFRIEDGVEQVALIPPTLLGRQVQLYESFLGDTRRPRNPSGQPADVSAHVYGLANSFRVGDVHDGSEYRTVGIVTLGPGGTGIAALDVTNVARPDADPYPLEPVPVLWTKVPGTQTNRDQLPDLKETWSVPAMGPASPSRWRLFAGSGFNPGNTRSAQLTGAGFVAPRAYVIDPATGDHVRNFTLTSKNSPAPWVGNQAFADAVFLDPRAKVYQDDNVGKLALQADLNGQVWFLDDPAGNLGYSGARVGIDVSTSQSQPIYYNPAASGYGATNAGCVAFAFGSGTLYERSESVTGAAVGTAGSFVPQLYVAMSRKDDIPAPLGASRIDGRPAGGTWSVRDGDVVVSKTLGSRTQLTAPPFLLVPRDGRGSLTALFLLYDPDEGCNGNSYVAVVEFEGSATCEPANVTYTAFDAGVGAASGFTIAGDKVLVSKSGIGEGVIAGLFEPPGIAASVGGVATPRVRWWRELK